MGLRVILQEDRVRIPKLKEEFSLILPKKELSQQVSKLLIFLQDSAYLQIKLSHQYQNQILLLFKSYGEALFQAIIPLSYQKQLTNSVNPDRELEICIYFIPWYEIHWELIHNGQNWHSLDGGVKRIYRGKAKMRRFETLPSWHFLSAPLAYGSQRTPTCEFFQTPIEWLPPEYKKELSRFEWNFCLQAKARQFQDILNQAPRYLYLEGFHDLEKFCFVNTKYKITKINLASLPFESAIEHGLELLVCNLKQIRTNCTRNHNILLDILLNLGLPNLIDCVGTLHKRTMAIFMVNFLVLLAQGKNINYAYLSAIKAVAKGGSWDWIWLRFWQNDTQLAAQQSHNKNEIKTTSADLFFSQQSLWTLRGFYGSLYFLEELETKILSTQNPFFVCDQYFQEAENFLHQFAINNYQTISTASVFFLPFTEILSLQTSNEEFIQLYQPIQNYLIGNENGLTIFHYQNLDQTKKDDKKILFIYLPFSKNPLEDQQKIQGQFLLWARSSGEHAKSYSLVFVYHNKIFDKQAFLLSAPSVFDSLKFFDATSQAMIEKYFKKEIFDRDITVSYRLLKMLFLLKINNLPPNLELVDIWKLVLSNFQRIINKKQKKILAVCFLFPIKLPILFLQDLLQLKVAGDIEVLYSYHLLEKNVTHTEVHLESGLKYLMTKYNFFEESQIQQLQVSFISFLPSESIFPYPRILLAFLYHYFPSSFILQNTKYLEKIYLNTINWELKKIFYTKLFEKTHPLSEKEELKWISQFYRDIINFSKKAVWVQRLQTFTDLLEDKEEWDLFFSCQMTACKFFISQGNFQKVKNCLAPVIELSKSELFSSEKIIDIALLLIEIEDNSTYLSLLEYFSSVFQERQINYSDGIFLRAYQLFLQGQKQQFFDMITNEMKEVSFLNTLRYHKIYRLYIKHCGEHKKTAQLYLFSYLLEKELYQAKSYKDYIFVIGDIFVAVVLNKTDYNSKISQDFFLLLEKIYHFAKINKDSKIIQYADILGKLYYQIGDEKKYKIYLEEYYKKPL